MLVSAMAVIALEATVTEESGAENGALDVASKAVALARR